MKVRLVSFGNASKRSRIGGAATDSRSSLRLQVFELELKCATIETETREELSRDTDRRMRDLERHYTEKMIEAVSISSPSATSRLDSRIPSNCY